MSTYDDASLIYYPSGYKESKAYSLKPTDGSGDLTFTRASTATRVNESGLIESVATDVPRIDFTGGGCAKLLLEPQRTNVIFPSNASTAWASIGGTTVTANVTTSPDGTLNATGMYESNTTSVFVKYKDATISTGAVSIYAIVKTNGRNILLGDLGGGGAESAKFDLVNGTIIAQNTSNNAYIESYGNGWYKVGFSMTKSGTLLRLGIYTLDYETSSTTHVGDPTKGIFIYQVQGEQGSYSTSNIPTTTTAVTRVADASVTTGLSSVIGQTEGVFYVEIAALANDNSGRYISISNSTNNNRIIIGFETTSDRIYVYVTSGGASQVSMFYEVPDILNFNKVAFKYKVNDFSLWVNGVERATDVSGSVPTSLTSITFNSGGGGNLFYGKMQNLMLFPSALSDTDLATLTTL